MASKIVVHQGGKAPKVVAHQGNKVGFDLGGKSVIFTRNENNEDAREGDIVVIFTNRKLPFKPPRIIYANQHAVQDSDGEVGNVGQWPGRDIPSILVDMLDVRASREKREHFQATVEEMLGGIKRTTENLSKP